jgi:hypothetical protein
LGEKEKRRGGKEEEWKRKRREGGKEIVLNYILGILALLNSGELHSFLIFKLPVSVRAPAGNRW